MSDDFEAFREEFDDHMVAVQSMSANSFWPSVVLACALCDRGLIDKGRLLDLTEAIIGVVSAEETGGLADTCETILPLLRFRDLLERLRLEPGRLLDELHTFEAETADQAIRRVRNSKRGR